MSNDDAGSVSHWIDGRKAGQPEAVDKLWNRYFQRVLGMAQRRLLSAQVHAVEDSEDVALSVIHSLCTGVALGRFDRLSDRVDLWQLLVAITTKKALSQRQREGALKRGGHKVILGQATEDSETAQSNDPNPLSRVLSKELTPDSAAVIHEQFQELLDLLGDSTLKQIALWRMDSLNNSEIARKMGCVIRTVERKNERIRLFWEDIGVSPYD
jgi:DNA-directed RNA polymerase specialized sigma24 family protein